MTINLGIMTPILSWKEHAPAWIQEGTIDDVAEVVGAAEGLGYDFCTCSEHVALPPSEVSRRSVAYWDPLASFSYLAATTSTIRLVTWLLVMGYHHPVELAKRYGQLDLMCQGRLVLGVGVGTLKEEFELVGAPFDGRGERADDAVRATAAIWGQEWAEYHGPHYDFADWWVVPHAPRPSVPIWVGGRTRRSVRRAVELGDGWMPFSLNLDEIVDVLGWARQLPAWEARGNRPFEVLVTSPELDPIGDADKTLSRLRAAEAAGVTLWGASFTSRSKEHYIDQLEALVQLAAKAAG